MPAGHVTSFITLKVVDGRYVAVIIHRNDCPVILYRYNLPDFQLMYNLEVLGVVG